MNAIAQTKDGYLWLATFNGLARFDGTRFHIFNRASYPDLVSNRLTALASSATNLLIGDYLGQLSYLENGSFTKVSMEPANYGDQVTAINIPVEGKIKLVRSRTGVTTLDFNPARAPANAPQPIIDHEGNIWTFTPNNGVTVSRHSETIAHFTAETGLPSDSVEDVFLDREGNIWVGTPRGLVQIKRRAFHTFEAASAAPIKGLVTSIVETNPGEIIAATRGSGLFRLEGEILAPFLLHEESILSLLKDKRGRIWVGSEDGKLWRSADNLTTLESINIPIAGDERRIFSIFEDIDGHLWFGTTQGVFRFDGRSFTHLSESDGLRGKAIRAINQDSNGAMWFGSQDAGISRYKDGTFENYDKSVGLISNTCWIIEIDPEGVIWTGSFGDGLSRIEPSTGLIGREAITGLSTDNGLWDNITASIISDDYGRVWIGSGRGVFSLDRAEVANYVSTGTPFQNTAYGRSEGVTVAEASGGHQRSVIRDSNGNFWFSSIRGIIRLDMSKLRQNKLAPPVIIEQMSVDEARFEPESEVYIIPPGGRHYRFDYTALSFTVPEKVNFKYKLEGFDQQWSHPTPERAAHYTLLPPGNYTFRVQAANNDGVWNKQGTSIAVSVEPFFWQTLTFKVFLAFAVATLLVLITRDVYRRRLRKQAEEYEREKMITDERARIARDLHENLGARLTHLNLMLTGDSPRQSIQGKTHEMALAMDEIVWSVDPERDSVEDLADYIISYCEEYLAESDIQLRIDVNDLVDTTLPVKQRHALFSLVKEALNNAVKYAACNEITVRIHADSNALELSVSDNGKGFDTNEATSVTESGLANMSRRMTDIGAECRISSGASGTTIQVRLPLISSAG